jgi:lysozyme family protein
MANYKQAIGKVLVSEGGYVNDPDDNGGETYKGISRKFWPEWLGWTIIDALRKESKFPKKPVTRNEIEIDNQLQYEVQMFYYHQFWIKVGGDQINDQLIADMLIDAAVNEGIVSAIKRAQQIVGLPQTGKINPELITKLNHL